MTQQGWKPGPSKGAVRLAQLAVYAGCVLVLSGTGHTLLQSLGWGFPLAIVLQLIFFGAWYALAVAGAVGKETIGFWRKAPDMTVREFLRSISDWLFWIAVLAAILLYGMMTGS